MIVSKKKLKYTLGYSFNDLVQVANNIEQYYYVFYKEKTKKDGSIKKRKIEPSKGELKKIQRLIARKILTKIELPNNLHGSLKGKSIITNSIPHLGKKYHFCTDLQKYYPSISHSDVFFMLRNHGFSTDISNVLTKLTTYKGSLPQGTPSSPIIANLVFLPTDFSLIKFCNQNGITYTRYVDDLIFSSQNCFKNKTIQLLKLIQKSGFKISNRKTFYKIGPIEITGILVKHNLLDIPDEVKNKDLSLLPTQSRIGVENYISQVKNYRKVKN